MSQEAAEIDTVFELCSDQNRRIILSALLSQNRTMTFRDLTEAIVNETREERDGAVSGEVLFQIHLELHHSHCPKLAAEGFVEYDSERNWVNPTGKLEEWQPQFSTVIDSGSGLEHRAEQ